jgi:hypothetical protein
MIDFGASYLPRRSLTSLDGVAENIGMMRFAGEQAGTALLFPERWGGFLNG